MRSILFSSLILLLASQCAYAQWRNVLHTGEDDFTVVYFLDPPYSSIGFAGSFQYNTPSPIFKTTDGGFTWSAIQTPLVNTFDFVFKDSLTGWAATEIGCYKTTDCGETWELLTKWYGTVGQSYINDVFYDKMSGGLFLSTWAGAWPVAGGHNELSWDEGMTWSAFGLVGREQSGGFAFVNGDSGLLSWNDYFNSDGDWWRTTDGGHNWNAIPGIDSNCWQPLAIQGTNTYFVNSWWGSILRTDDAGDTWTLLYSFPPQNRIFNGEDNLPSSSCIRGTLDSLFVMVCSGCYLSTDQGVSWKYLCGVPDLIRPFQRFFVNDRKVFVCGADSNESCSVWMLNLDSLNIITSNYSERFRGGTKQKTISPGDTAFVQFLSTDTLGSNVAVDSVFLWASYDTQAVSPVTFTPPPGWKIADTQLRMGRIYAELIDTDSVSLDSSRTLLTISYRTWLNGGGRAGSTDLRTMIYLDSVHTFGHRLNCDCAVSSILSADTASISLYAALDSVELDFAGCGDSILLSFMNGGKLVFNIESIVPNPAQNEIRVSVTGLTVSGMGVELFDMLGRQQNANPTFLLSEIAVDVSNIPPGTYYLRLAASGYVQTRKVSIER